MESNMELDDDLILVIVGDEDSSHIQLLEEDIHTEDEISDQRAGLEMLDDDNLLVTTKEPVNLRKKATEKKKNEQLYQESDECASLEKSGNNGLLGIYKEPINLRKRGTKKEKNDVISDERATLESSSDKDLQVINKEEPVNLRKKGTKKKKNNVISDKKATVETSGDKDLVIDKKPINLSKKGIKKNKIDVPDFSQLQNTTETFLNFLQCRETFVEGIKLGRGRGRPRKSTVTVPEATQPTLQIKKSTEKKLEDSKISDDLIAPEKLLEHSAITFAEAIQLVPKKSTEEKLVDSKLSDDLISPEKLLEDPAVTSAEAVQAVRRGRGRPKKSTQKKSWFRSSRRRLKPNLKYDAYKTELAKMSTKKREKSNKNIKIINNNNKSSYNNKKLLEDLMKMSSKKRENRKNKLLEDLLKSDDFGFPLSWFKNDKTKAHQNTKRKSINKNKSFEASAASSDNNVASLELQKTEGKADSKVKCNESHRNSSKKEKELSEDSDVSSDNNNEEVVTSSPQHCNIRCRANANLKYNVIKLDEEFLNKEEDLLEDTAISSDDNCTFTPKHYNTRSGRRVKVNPKYNVTDLEKEWFNEEEENEELLEDTAISSDDNCISTPKHSNSRPRRSNKANPKYNVIELEENSLNKEEEELFKDTEENCTNKEDEELLEDTPISSDDKLISVLKHSNTIPRSRAKANSKYNVTELEEECLNEEEEESIKKEELFEDTVISSDDNCNSTLKHFYTRPRRRVKANPKYVVEFKEECLKEEEKEELLEDTAISSDDNCNSTLKHSYTRPRRRVKANPKYLAEFEEECFKEEEENEELLDDTAINSDDNFISTPKEEDEEEKQELLEDTAISSDDNLISTPIHYNTRPRLRAKTKLKKKCIKKELFEDTAVSSDDNITDHFFHFRDLRRSFNPNPISYVAELMEQHPQMADDSEALLEALCETMRQVRPPTPPQDYFVMNDTRFECTICGQLSRTKARASKHYYEKHGPRYLICFACGVDFRSRTNLYAHEMRCIARDAPVVLKARARFLGAKGRNRPFLDQVPPKPKPAVKRLFPCPMCSAKFVAPAWLRGHINTHLGIRPYVCEVCGLAYASSTTLSKHRQKHSNRVFICDYCGRSFKVKAMLASHIDTHQSRHRFACAECPRRFAKRDNLLRHERRVHRRLPHAAACALCPKRYPKTWFLKQHMLREHGVTIMTRTMFYKQLPKMTETELKEATVVANADLYNTSYQYELSDQDGRFYVSRADDDSQNNSNINVDECQPQEMDVDNGFEIKILNDDGTMGSKGVLIELGDDQRITLCKATQDATYCGTTEL